MPKITDIMVNGVSSQVKKETDKAETGFPERSFVTLPI
jgi:hypothetical protein